MCGIAPRDNLIITFKKPPLETTIERRYFKYYNTNNHNNLEIDFYVQTS